MIGSMVFSEVLKNTPEKVARVLESDDLPSKLSRNKEINALPSKLTRGDRAGRDASPEKQSVEMKEIPETNSLETSYSRSVTLKDGTVVTLPDAKAMENVTKADNTEEQVKKGGSYKDVKTDGEGEKYEVHHMPADSASNLERVDGPAIKMEKEDHRKTASCGMSREAREYRENQRELIEQGKFREALQMDIDDIHEKFGDKYEDAIGEMLEYVDQLEKEGKI